MGQALLRAAREIHQQVPDLTMVYQGRIGKSLAMHTGINTGLVILGDIDIDHGTHGISGETVNLTARLCDLGRASDILVGQETFIQSQGWFRFDRLEPVRVEMDHNLGNLLKDRKAHLPFIGSLFGIHYSEIADIRPEYWRARLKTAIRDLLAALARLGPTVICIEDLHWADPSSVDLLRFIAGDQSLPLLMICTYRRTFSLFEEVIYESRPKHLIAIGLKDLTE